MLLTHACPPLTHDDSISFSNRIPLQKMYVLCQRVYWTGVLMNGPVPSALLPKDVSGLILGAGRVANPTYGDGQYARLALERKLQTKERPEVAHDMSDNQEVGPGATVTLREITEETVIECKNLGIGKVWMQPGSESKGAIRFCRENNIKVLHGVCVMLERRKDGKGG